MQINPFIGGGVNALPNQMLSKKQKDQNWKELTMNALESVGLLQYYENVRFYENYKLLNGEFITKHYLENVEEDIYDPVVQFTKKMKLPNYIRHYDIISQPINTLTGEASALPETTKAIASGDAVASQRARALERMTEELVYGLINQEIEAELIRRGEGDKQFATPEEQQAYLQQLEEKKLKMLKDSGLEKFDAEWSHIAEKWANIQLKNNLNEFNQRESFRVEFKDMLASTRCFKHFYLTPYGRDEETWNPINTFYQKDPGIKNPEDGAFIGRLAYMHAESIINKYGSKLTEDQIKSLRTFATATADKGGVDAVDVHGNKIDYLSIQGKPYGVELPYTDDILDIWPQAGNNPVTNLQQLYYAEGNLPILYRNLYLVTEAYWFAQKKIYKVHTWNEELQTIEIEIADEDFIIPKGFKEVKASFDDDSYKDTPNIVISTWVNELWQGKKITGGFGQNYGRTPIYFDIKPAPFQCKAEKKLWDKKLPVVGLIYNNRNIIPQSLVDMMKPYQIFYNVIMNYLRAAFDKQLLPFVVVDPNMIPNTADWGERSLEKWMEAGQSTQATIADTSYNTTAGAQVQGGQFPRVIDLDTSQRLITYANLAERIRTLALAQIGFNDQRLGDIKSTETATGVQQAISKSYSQTSNYFAEFSDYKRRVKQMGLNFDQFVQSKMEDLTIYDIHSDISKQWLKLNGTDLLTVDLHVFLDDTPEAAERLRLIKQFALENNTINSKLSTRINILEADTITTIRELVKIEEEEFEELRKQQQAMEQQQIEMQQQMHEAELQQENEHFYADLQNKLQQAYIKVFGGVNNSASDDANGNGNSDILEYTKITNEANNNDRNYQLQKQKLDNERLEILTQKDKELIKAQINSRDIANKRYLDASKNLRVDKMMGLNKTKTKKSK